MHVLVWLFKAIELSDVMEIVLVNDNGPLHFHLGHDTRPHVVTLLVRSISCLCKCSPWAS